MKQSLSTTSLTALSEVLPEMECFICLETEKPLIHSSIQGLCDCKYAYHIDCWYKWVKSKHGWECPMCHKTSVVKIVIREEPIRVEAIRVEVIPVENAHMETIRASFEADISAIRPFYQYYCTALCILLSIIVFSVIFSYVRISS